ncbi:acyl-CoA thioesterase [Pedobacter sp. LMG 31464]|uniref:Acyl-CoA thioesterase n=1 Tax=Pedobacter planticolens TaxID=2679964 RepID=A0A923IWE0_9SPHI|nr:thioesterase family protein [Pedobacter planticolens]MBB2145077.1 acyl-CoA thioesterase [Pedobacter planticolens]
MFFKTFWRKKEKQTDKKSVTLGHIDSFKYKTAIEMRFADLDMMGHVNNAVYFTYMEIARTKYWNHAINWDWHATGVVIGQASIDYIAPLFLGDKITMYVRTSRIGTTSFDLEYLIVKAVNGKEIICSKGKTVCVAFDYISKKPAAIPDKERNKMMEFEQLV